MNRLMRAVPVVAASAGALVVLVAGAALASPLVFIWGASTRFFLFR